MRFGLVLLAGLMMVIGCGSKHPDSGLPVVSIDVGGHDVKAEVARSVDEQARGLMYRRKLGKDEGMIFVYDHDSVLTFWMKNTFVPLDILYIKADHTVATIKAMKPQTTSTYSSEVPVRYALEVNQGWAKAHGIEPGATVAFELPTP
jgi:uncharacterized membrane protein (UPF0127 family)